jgi:hypothetical protein
MPGDVYTAVLSRFHERLRPASYAEIGVRCGDSLALAGRDTSAAGIDPRLIINRPILSRARLYPLPSDEFFGRYDLLEELGTPRLALAFIDGLHLFEQALKDFINIERYADPQTAVLIHDCLPVSRLAAARRQHMSAIWCGDTWKLVPCLRKCRPDLTIRIIPTFPSGLGVVTGCDRGSVVLRERFDEIVAERRDLELSYEYLTPEILNATAGILPNDPEHIDEALSRLLG